MFKNKSMNNKNNLCGHNIAKLRKSMKPTLSQRALAEKLQVMGLDIDKNAVQRMESGQRFVTDIELLAFARLFQVSTDDLLKEDD